jgi:hypothetical protein
MSCSHCSHCAACGARNEDDLNYAEQRIAALTMERDRLKAKLETLIAEVRQEAEHCFTMSRLLGYDTSLLEDLGDDLIKIADLAAKP